MSSLPDMPTLSTPEGEVERHNVYRRLNPMGHEETVTKRQGKPDEEILNELSTDILHLIEDVDIGGNMPAMATEQPLFDRVVNQTSPPQLVASRGDPARANGDTITNMSVAPSTSQHGLGMGPMPADSPEDSRAKSSLNATARAENPNSKYMTVGYNGDNINYSATHSESFVGTGSIAIMPAILGSPKRKRNRSKPENDALKLETSIMASRVIREWQPTFKGAGYAPGDHQMDKPEGNGVADRNPTHDNVGKYDTELSQNGKEWPRDHNDTEAMCDVDEDGVEHEPQGSHESTHGEADDGIQKKFGHNWPNQPKNTGQMNEPFEGTRWSDGGTLTGGTAPTGGDYGDNSGESVAEGWSPEKFARLMSEDLALQPLFDSYARQVQAVCSEEFQDLIRAHGSDIRIDDSSLLALMEANSEFVFHQRQDASGYYWLLEEYQPEGSITEGTISELQIRSPEAEAGLYNDRDSFPPTLPGDPHRDTLGGHDEASQIIDDPADSLFGGGMSELECPGCGYAGQEESCPECGTEMMSMEGESDIPSPYSTNPDQHASDMGAMRDFGSMGRPSAPQSPLAFESRSSIINSPQITESLKNFMASAKSMLTLNKKASPKDIAEALNHSWDFYAGSVNAKTCPTQVVKTLQGLMQKFPGFNPLTESEGMDGPEGTKLGGGDGPKDNLPKQPSEMKTLGEKNLLGKSQKNTTEGPPVIQGTGKGMNESAERIMQQNIEKLGVHIKRHVQESAKSLSSRTKYTLSFSTVIDEGKMPDFIKDKMKGKNDKGAKGIKDKGGKQKPPPPKKKRTPNRDNLAEALADAEEILQLNNPADVKFETVFYGPSGQIAMKQDIPLFTIMPRGPILGEGKLLFRFTRNAEAFADALVNEGVSCRVRRHNWGMAVEAKTNYQLATRAFQTIAECGSGCAVPKKKKKK